MGFRLKARSFGVARTGWKLWAAIAVLMGAAIAELVLTRGQTAYASWILAALWVGKALGPGSTSKAVDFLIPSPTAHPDPGRQPERRVTTPYGEPVALHPEHGLLLANPDARAHLPESVWLSPRRVSIRAGGRLFSLPGLRILLPAVVILQRLAPFAFALMGIAYDWPGWFAYELAGIIFAMPLYVTVAALLWGSVGKSITLGRDGMVIGRIRRRFIRWTDITEIRVEKTWLSIFAERVTLVPSSGSRIVLALPSAFGAALKSLIEELRDRASGSRAPAAKTSGSISSVLEGDGYRGTGTTVEAALEQLQNPGLPARDRVRIATQLQQAGEPIQPVLETVSEHDCDPELLAEIEALKASAPRRVA